VLHLVTGIARGEARHVVGKLQETSIGRDPLEIVAGNLISTQDLADLPFVQGVQKANLAVHPNVVFLVPIAEASGRASVAGVLGAARILVVIAWVAHRPLHFSPVNRNM